MCRLRMLAFSSVGRTRQHASARADGAVPCELARRRQHASELRLRGERESEPRAAESVPSWARNCVYDGRGRHTGYARTGRMDL